MKAIEKYNSELAQWELMGAGYCGMDYPTAKSNIK